MGYACAAFPFSVELAWLAGLLAVATAYVRCLGASLIGNHYFWGPMAKQHRMALITGLTLLSIFESSMGLPTGILLYVGLGLMVIGMW